MRYRIVAVGQLRRGFLRDGCRHYLERLERFAKVEVVERKEARGNPEQIRSAESASLLEAAADLLVALDERGRSWTTRRLARHLADLEQQGVSRISLLIGGAEGHHPSLLDRVDESWRLSSLTLPHELARLLLLEQLYRVESLRAGHPYHRG